MVRRRSAKPLFIGSNPIAASKKTEGIRRNGLILFYLFALSFAFGSVGRRVGKWLKEDGRTTRLTGAGVVLHPAFQIGNGFGDQESEGKYDNDEGPKFFHEEMLGIELK